MDDNSRRGAATITVSTGFALLAYFFALAQPLSPELTAVPRWVVPLGDGQGRATADRRIPFTAGDRFGYFAEDGSVFFMASAPGGAAISEGAWATRETPRLFRADDGKAGASIEGAPFFMSGTLYSGLADGTGLNAYDADGALKWSYRFPVQLSAFAASPTLAVGGTVDGWLEGVDQNGHTAFSFAPGGSRLPVILGLAVSGSGNRVAAIAGLDRQRLLVLGKGGADYRVESHRYLDSDYRSPVPVAFLGDEEHVLYLRPDGIGVWAADGSQDALLPVAADDFTVSLDQASGVGYLVARRGPASELVAFIPPARVLGRADLPEHVEYVLVNGASVYFYAGGRLARIDFRQE